MNIFTRIYNFFFGESEVSASSTESTGSSRSNVYVASSGGLATYVMPSAPSDIKMLDSVLISYDLETGFTKKVSVISLDGSTGVLVEATGLQHSFVANIGKALSPAETLLIESTETGVEFRAVIGISR